MKLKNLTNLLPAILFALMIFILSSIPGDKFPVIEFTIFSLDKLVHATIYAIFGFLTAHALYHQNIFPYLKANWFISGVFLTLLYAISDETHQCFVPNRSSDIMDINADLVGILLSHILFKYFPTPWFGKD